MELLVQQKIYYSNREVVPIREVAEALIALEGIILQSPPVLEALFPGTSIQKVEVYLQELRSDSIYEDLIVKFIFGSQEKLDLFIQNLREKTGMERLGSNGQILAAVLLAMTLFGGGWLLGRDKTADPNRQVTIQANNNVIINIGADMLLKFQDFPQAASASSRAIRVFCGGFGESGQQIPKPSLLRSRVRARRRSANAYS
ncbi:hypothetical protein LRB11_16475, partial [Ectothiorhodospira haloalkaliphila]|nr:hypothetical protein [Ectothiorhodospira haloalkaliphila]